MLDTVKINHVQHISFTQSRLTDAVSVILSELLSYEHPSKARARKGAEADAGRNSTAVRPFFAAQSGKSHLRTDAFCAKIYLSLCRTDYFFTIILVGMMILSCV